MDRFNGAWLRNVAAFVVKKATSLSTTQVDFSVAEVGNMARLRVNELNYHNPVREWIGTPRRINQKPGTPFGKPTDNTSDATLWKSKPKHNASTADTRVKRKSLIPTRDATPPNPGRPEFGRVGEREYR